MRASLCCTEINVVNRTSTFALVPKHELIIALFDLSAVGFEV
jgi:hypothetical protein